MVRSSVGTVGFMSFTFGLEHCPLVIGNTLINTAPFWAAILAFCLLGEKLTKLQGIALLLSFCGIVIISLSPKKAEKNEDEKNENYLMLIGCVWLIASAWCLAIVSVYTRRM